MLRLSVKSVRKESGRMKNRMLAMSVYLVKQLSLTVVLKTTVSVTLARMPRLVQFHMQVRVSHALLGRLVLSVLTRTCPGVLTVLLSTITTEQQVRHAPRVPYTALSLTRAKQPACAISDIKCLVLHVESVPLADIEMTTSLIAQVVPKASTRPRPGKHSVIFAQLGLSQQKGAVPNLVRHRRAITWTKTPYRSHHAPWERSRTA